MEELLKPVIIDFNLIHSIVNLIEANLNIPINPREHYAFHYAIPIVFFNHFII